MRRTPTTQSLAFTTKAPEDDARLESNVEGVEGALIRVECSAQRARAPKPKSSQRDTKARGNEGRR